MISEILSPNMTVNNMINNGFYAKSETFGGNGRRTPIWQPEEEEVNSALKCS